MEEKNSPAHHGNLGQQLARKLSAASDWTWSHPATEETKWVRALHILARVFAILFREFQNDRIPLRASALTFTIVLSMVPILALGTAVLKGLGAGDQMRQAAYRLIEQLETSPPSPEADLPKAPAKRMSDAPPGQQQPAAPPGAAKETPAQESLTTHLRTAVNKVFDYVNRTNFATLGAFGVLGLLFAVISVLGSIEQSMNAIWQTGSNRPFGRRVLDYMALMLLLPISINLTLATGTMLQSPALHTWLDLILPSTWLQNLLFTMLPILLVVATFTILYRFLPNTNVRFIPALAGGAFGGLGWFVTQSLYIKMQIGVARYNAIYGSFATLPLFLVWIYVGWVVFLCGAEMAFAVQSWRRYNPRKKPVSPVVRLTLAFTIVAAIQRDFKARRVTVCKDLVSGLDLPDSVVLDVVDVLLQGGIIRRVDGSSKEDGYVPAAPADGINPAEIVELILGTDMPQLQGSALAAEALQAATGAVSGKDILHPAA